MELHASEAESLVLATETPRRKSLGGVQVLFQNERMQRWPQKKVATSGSPHMKKGRSWQVPSDPEARAGALGSGKWSVSGGTSPPTSRAGRR